MTEPSRRCRRIAAMILAAMLAGCATGEMPAPPPPPQPEPPPAPVVKRAPKGFFKLGAPYRINGTWYKPSFDWDYQAEGEASWYGAPFHGRSTANGEIFDQNDLSAAHQTLPLPSVIRVTNLANGRSLVLRVNDRGPFVGDRILDVSRRAASLLKFRREGITRVKVELLEKESRQAARAAGWKG